MYRRALLPRDFVVPTEITGDGFVLRPLRLSDAERDFAAVIASAEHLLGTMDPTSDWPTGLTLHENRVDLGWHEREFTSGHSFSYTVLDADEVECIGCAYVYPSDKAGFQAMAFWWVCRSAADPGRDARVGRAFRAALSAWPLAGIAFPGRDIEWSDWLQRPDT